jgi:hypothetical protein
MRNDEKGNSGQLQVAKRWTIDSWTGYPEETDRWAVCGFFSILKAQKLSMR